MFHIDPPGHETKTPQREASPDVQARAAASPNAQARRAGPTYGGEVDSVLRTDGDGASTESG